MESLIKEHIQKFGVEPIIIGVYWDDLEKLAFNIYNAIVENKAYDEYELLSEEDKPLFKQGKLFF